MPLYLLPASIQNKVGKNSTNVVTSGQLWFPFLFSLFPTFQARSIWYKCFFQIHNNFLSLHFSLPFTLPSNKGESAACPFPLSFPRLNQAIIFSTTADCIAILKELRWQLQQSRRKYFCSCYCLGILIVLFSLLFSILLITHLGSKLPVNK